MLDRAVGKWSKPDPTNKGPKQKYHQSYPGGGDEVFVDGLALNSFEFKARDEVVATFAEDEAKARALGVVSLPSVWRALESGLDMLRTCRW